MSGVGIELNRHMENFVEKWHSGKFHVIDHDVLQTALKVAY